MAFFGLNQKPGRGLSREEASKREYFGIFGRKIWQMIQINLLFFVCNIVLFAAIAYMALPFFVAENTDFLNYIKELISGKTLLPIMYFIPFMFFGPTYAGITYITRNFAKQEPVFIASDFFAACKKNFFKGLAASVILTLLHYAYFVAVIFYINMSANRFLTLVFATIVGFALSFTSFYVYPIMITFDLKLRHIFKNAWLMSFINFPRNLLVLAILAVVHVALIYYVSGIWAILMAVFLIAFSSYTINFFAWDAIEKYMITPEHREQNE